MEMVDLELGHVQRTHGTLEGKNVWGYAEALDRFSNTDIKVVHALHCSHLIQTLASGDSRYSIHRPVSVVRPRPRVDDVHCYYNYALF